MQDGFLGYHTSFMLDAVVVALVLAYVQAKYRVLHM